MPAPLNSLPGLSQTGPPTNAQYVAYGHRFKGHGSPEGVIMGSIGDDYLDLDTWDVWNKVFSEGAKTGWEVVTSDTANVVEFGAIGDGVANDAPAIQEALDAAALAGGGRIYLPHGVYRINTTLNITGSMVTLLGSSRGAIIVNHGTGPTVKVTAAAYVVLASLSLYGSIQASYGVGAVNTYGIEFDGCNYAILDNVAILYHGSHGIYNHGAGSSHEYFSLNVRHNAGDGYHSVSPSGAEQNGNSTKIFGGHFNLNGGAGIRWSAAALLLSGVSCEANLGPGACADSTGTTLTTKGFVVEGGYFEQNIDGQINILAGAGFAGGKISGVYLRWGLGGGASTKTALINGSGAGAIQFLDIQPNSYSLFPVDAGVTHWINLGNRPTDTCIISDLQQTALVTQLGSAKVVSFFTPTDINTSAKLRAIITDETGTGAAVFATNPQFGGSIGIGVAAPGTLSQPIYAQADSNGTTGPLFENVNAGVTAAAGITFRVGTGGNARSGVVAMLNSAYSTANVANRMIMQPDGLGSGLTAYLSAGQNWDVQVANVTVLSASSAGVNIATALKLSPITKAARDAIIVDGNIINQSDGTPGLKVRIGGAWLALSATADP